jgi:hypothetical protein
MKNSFVFCVLCFVFCVLCFVFSVVWFSVVWFYVVCFVVLCFLARLEVFSGGIIWKTSTHHRLGLGLRRMGIH